MQLFSSGGQGISAGFDDPEEPEAQVGDLGSAFISLDPPKIPMVSAEAGGSGGSRKGKVAYSGGLVLEPQAPESRPRAENSPGFAELFYVNTKA